MDLKNIIADLDNNISITPNINCRDERFTEHREDADERRREDIDERSHREDADEHRR